MSEWLDSWTNTRYLNQQTLAKRWASRGEATVKAEVNLSVIDEMREYVKTTELRPMRKGEKPPIEFADRQQQEAFEAYARKYWWMLRVPT